MSTYLLKAQKNPDNVECRNQTLLGSLLGGLAFSNASLGAVHAMAHSLGGFSDLPHGACNAILLGPVIDFNFEACPARYEAIGKLLNVNSTGLAQGETKHNINIRHHVPEAGARRHGDPFGTGRIKKGYPRTCKKSKT